jgi:hypothetical protein
MLVTDYTNQESLIRELFLVQIPTTVCIGAGSNVGFVPFDPQLAGLLRLSDQAHLVRITSFIKCSV